MSTREQLLNELERTSEPLLAEILDFVRFVKSRREPFETAAATEPVLREDWLRPEEDAAWDDL